MGSGTGGNNLRLEGFGDTPGRSLVESWCPLETFVESRGNHRTLEDPRQVGLRSKEYESVVSLVGNFYNKLFVKGPDKCSDSALSVYFIRFHGIFRRESL